MNFDGPQLFLSEEARQAAIEKEYPHKSDVGCRKCGKTEVRYLIGDGDYADYHIRCFACGDSYWVDGPDA